MNPFIISAVLMKMPVTLFFAMFLPFYHLPDTRIQKEEKK